MRGRRVALQVVVPAADVGGKKDAGRLGVLFHPWPIGCEHRVGVEPSVPGIQELRWLRSAAHDVEGLGDVVALLDEIPVSNEVGDGEVLWDQLEINPVLFFQIRNEGPLRSGHDRLSVEILETGNGVVRMEHQHGGIILENRPDVDHGQPLRDREEDVGAILLGDVRLSGGDLLEGKRVGAAREEHHVESGFPEKSPGLSLVETPVLGFRDPVELNRDAGESGRRWLRCRDDGIRGAAAAGRKKAEDQQGEGTDNAAERTMHRR